MRFSGCSSIFTISVLFASFAGCGPGEQAPPAVDSTARSAYWCGDGTYPPGLYTPYPEPGAYPSGPAGANYPWQSKTTETNPNYPYPNGSEQFEYSTVPTTVECSSDRSARSYLDMVGGCLDAVPISGTSYKRGRPVLSNNFFQGVALGYTAADQVHPIKWTDQKVEFRFYQISAFAPSDPAFAGVSAIVRFRTGDDFYVATWRKDGQVVIKKKLCGVYTQLAAANIGTFAPGSWHWLRFEAVGQDLKLFVDDIERLDVQDASFSWGTVGMMDEYTNVYVDDWSLIGANTYDQVVLGDSPIAYWAMSNTSGTEADLSGHGHTGTYQGGTLAASTMPNGDAVSVFNGSTQYLTIPSAASMSIPTTSNLTWEGWIRPDTLEFPHSSAGGYVAWMGKCQDYSPTCEWEARMYKNSVTDRCSRVSAYAFNPGAGQGSGAFWQATDCGLFQAGNWYHVVAEYTTLSQPAVCNAQYPGSINIWVNGIPWDQTFHGTTGCMSQYSVTPVPNNSPLNIGSMTGSDTWFQGAIGKVAIYDYLLSDATIKEHYQTMTGQTPMGNCDDTCSF